MGVVLVVTGLGVALAGVGGLAVLRSDPVLATQEALKGGALLVGMGLVLLVMGGLV